MCRAKKHEATTGIEVRDSGPGLSKNRGSTCSRPFTPTKEGGTGLGLAVSRELAVGMGGALHYRNNGPGATFEIELPAGQRRKMRSATILIAEDERTARNSLAGLLEAEGFRVLAAETGTRPFPSCFRKSRKPLFSTFACREWMV